MTRLLIAAMFAVAANTPIIAQEKVPVRFETGTSGTTIDGSITGDEYLDYVLGASAGQEMKVTLKVTQPNTDGTLPFFNILPPGSDGYPAIYVGANEIEPNEAISKLPDSGDYTIRVYQMGNAKDGGLTTGYELEMTIE